MEVVDPCNALLTNIELSSLLDRLPKGPSSCSPNLSTLAAELRTYLDNVGLPSSLRVPTFVQPDVKDKELDELKNDYQQQQKKQLAEAHSKLNDLAHLLLREAPLNAPQLLALLNELTQDPSQVSTLLASGPSVSGTDQPSATITEQQIFNLAFVVQYALYSKQ